MEQTLVSRTNLHVAGTLRWLGSTDRYSEYRAPDGTFVHLAHGTARVLRDIEDIDLDALWTQHRRDYGTLNGPVRVAFLDALRDMLIEPEQIEDYELAFCEYCSDVTIDGDGRETSGNGHLVCVGCTDDLIRCESCEELYRYTTTTLNDTEVCESCRDNHWSYCEDCDGYYPSDYYGDHLHDGSGCCDVPEEAVAFTIRNDGEEPLANDTRATVRLPAGVIDAEGIGAIAQLLRNHARTLLGEEGLTDEDHERINGLWALTHDLIDKIGDTWQTRQGNFTKRLSRYVYNEFKVKIPQEIISQTGCIASDHSRSVDVNIETTRLLNMSAEDFYHEDSCWWQSYSSSRCALKSNGGFGLRTFDDYDSVTGRAWVMPLRRTESGALTPTFETSTPDAYVVFNGYGDLEGYAPARIVAHMAGWTYRKVGFSASPMYVNNDSGYLVAPEEIASDYTDGSLSFYLDQHSSLFYTESQKELTNA